MQRTLTNRRRTVALSLVIMVATGFVSVQQVRAQDPAPSTSRMRVLVPMLERKGTVPPDFGKKVADEVAKSISSLPRHVPVAKTEVKEALKKYKLKEEELDCIKDRQLAVQINAELVMCGSYESGASGYQVSAQFTSAKTGETFEVAPFAATDPAQAAQHIFQSFNNYIQQISLAAYCSDYLGSSQWDKALENCNNALAINPSSQVALKGKGMALYRMGMSADQSGVADSAKLVEAQAVYKKVLELNPVEQDALKQSGILAARLGQADQSRQFFKQYLELNPGDAAVRLAIASEAAKNGDPEGAMRLIDEGLAADTMNVDLNTYAGHFAVAAAAKAGEAEKAAPFFSQAAKYYGRVLAAKDTATDPSVLQNYILALVQPGVDRKADAVAVGQKAITAKPNEASLWVAYATALQANGQLDQALAALENAVAKDPKTPRVAFRRASWLLDAGKLDQAVTAFKQAVAAGDMTADDAANAIFRPGFEAYRASKFDTALDYFAAAREIATSGKVKGMANYWSGLVYYQRGIPVAKPQTTKAAKEALPLFQRALSYLQGEGVQEYAAATRGVNVGQMVDAVQQYIKIQNQVIAQKR